MPNRNDGLNAAGRARRDEFYTLMPDIERELRHYARHFAGRTVLCNCDDPLRSNFFRYFVLNFNRLGLKKLIATCRAGGAAEHGKGMPQDEARRAARGGGKIRSAAGNTRSMMLGATPRATLQDCGYGGIGSAYGQDAPGACRQAGRGCKAVVTAVPEAFLHADTGRASAGQERGKGAGANDGPKTAGVNGLPDMAALFGCVGNECSALEGDGDFRSPECLALLDEADIVATNPPFSLFREYVATLMGHEKKFVIIGHQNALTCREIFPLFRENRMWTGYGFKRNCAHFISPYGDAATDLDHKAGMIRVSGVLWFTNLDVEKRHARLALASRHDAEAYPAYDNYGAIEVGRTRDIPCDYAGAMGVPVTFLEKYSPDQFEILGADFDLAGPVTIDGKCKPAPQRFYVGGVRKYARIVIRNRHPA